MKFKSVLLYPFLILSLFLYSCESNDGLIVKGNPDSKDTNKVLVELFTNFKCVPCVQANNLLNGINKNLGITNNDTSVIIIRIHTNLFTGDPYYNFNIPANNSRIQYYNAGISNPKGFLMGTNMGNIDAAVWTNKINERLGIINTFEIRSDLEFFDTLRNGELHIYVKKLSGSSLQDYVMHIAVVENGLIMNPPAPNGESDFENTLRDFITPLGGEPVSISAGQTLFFKEYFTLKDGIEPDETYFIIFVQSLSTKEVFGVVKQKLIL